MILVTGGTGLLGSHLLYDLVKSGKRVRALKRSNSNIADVQRTFSYYINNSDELFSEIEWVDGNVLDIFSLLDAMEGVDEVYHCAAIVSFSQKNQEELLKININGTENTINAALEKGIKKFCHVSSVAALGKEENESEIIEETFWKSSPENTVYSISKYGAEREVWRGVQEGLNVVVVNPSIIIGPGNWKKGSSNMFHTAYNGNKYYTYGATGFVDVRDVSKAMISLMESSIKNERFIVSSENIHYQHFFDLVHEELGIRKPYLKAGKILSEIIWRMEKARSFITGLDPLITKETARTAHKKSCFSNKKIRKALEFEFIPMEQSIKDTCKLFLQDNIK